MHRCRLQSRSLTPCCATTSGSSTSSSSTPAAAVCTAGYRTRPRGSWTTASALVRGMATLVPRCTVSIAAFASLVSLSPGRIARAALVEYMAALNPGHGPAEGGAGTDGHSSKGEQAAVAAGAAALLAICALPMMRDRWSLCCCRWSEHRQNRRRADGAPAPCAGVSRTRATCAKLVATAWPAESCPQCHQHPQCTRRLQPCLRGAGADLRDVNHHGGWPGPAGVPRPVEPGAGRDPRAAGGRGRPQPAGARGGERWLSERLLGRQRAGCVRKC